MLDTTRKTTTRSTTWRAVATATAGVVLAVAVSACSPDEAGSAAVVGERRISTEQVSTALAEIRTVTSEEVPGAQVLFWLVIAPQVIPAAQANGLAVSAAEARAVLAKVSEPAPATIEAVRTALTLQKLKGAKSGVVEQIRRQVLASHPRVNPRYGTFDAKQMGIVQDLPNWMVQQPGADTVPTPPAGS